MRRILIIAVLSICSFGLNAQTSERVVPEFTTLRQAPGDSITEKVVITQDARLVALMEKNLEINKAHKGISGYRIQIFSGSGSEARKDAQHVRAEFLKIFPTLETTIVYDEPYYKTRVGNFRNRTEGYKVYKAISKHFPSCYFVIESEMEYPELD